MKKFVIQFFSVYFAFGRDEIKQYLKIDNIMENLHKILELFDSFREINDCKTSHMFVREIFYGFIPYYTLTTIKLTKI